MNEKVFHIAFADDWEGAQRFGEYEVSTRGKTLDDVGYIHATTEDKICQTASTVYQDAGLPLVALAIDCQALRAAGGSIAWDDHEQQAAPHAQRPRIMGPLPVDSDVVEPHTLVETSPGEWILG